jgi:hypothetical protein
VAEPGQKDSWTGEQRSTCHYLNHRKFELSALGRILLVEDDPKDVDLTLTALEEYHLANEVVVARDGEEALDYLYQRGSFAGGFASRPETAQGRRIRGPETGQVGRETQDNSGSSTNLFPRRKRYGG